MYNLGMPTLLEVRGVRENALLCQSLGLSFLELDMNLPWCCPENLPAAEALRVCQEFDIDLTLHLPEELDLASFHPPLRQAAVARVRQAMLWAQEAGARVVTMHINPGIYFTLPERRAYIYDEFVQQFCANLMESTEEVLAYSRDAETPLCLENTGNFHLPFISQALELLADLPGFWLTWDVGHDAASGYRERNLLVRHSSRIAHMHLHDFDGARSHQPLFTGLVDIAEALQFADEENLRVVLDVKTREALTQTVDALRERLLFVP